MKAMRDTRDLATPCTWDIRATNNPRSLSVAFIQNILAPTTTDVASYQGLQCLHLPPLRNLPQRRLHKPAALMAGKAEVDEPIAVEPAGQSPPGS